MTPTTLAETILRDVKRYSLTQLGPVEGGQWLHYPDVLSAITTAIDPAIAERAGEVVEGISAGPWTYCQNKDGDFDIKRQDGLVVLEILHVDDQSEPDARFIAWCREGVPALLAQLAALRAERDEYADAFKVDNAALGAALLRAEAAEAERDALRAERDELERQVPRFPDHMARILEAKNAGLPERLQALVAALEAIPEYMRQYQWVADQKQAFGSKWVRAICGDNGKGMGRQAIAEVEGHIDVADFIAAANPDTVALMLAQIAALTARVEKLTGAATWAMNHVSTLPMDEATQSEFMRHRAALTTEADNG